MGSRHFSLKLLASQPWLSNQDESKASPSVSSSLIEPSQCSAAVHLALLNDLNRKKEQPSFLLCLGGELLALDNFYGLNNAPYFHALAVHHVFLRE